MPIVPEGSFNPMGDSPGMLAASPSKANLLMAAATMAKMGRLGEQQPSMPAGTKDDPIKARSRRHKLKVVR